YGGYDDPAWGRDVALSGSYEPDLVV
ncbi:MAG: hypothetical protein ACI9ND_003363, partial [Yoonia sp.]